MQVPYQTCQLISVEFRPYPAPAALVVQYRVALWGQRRATYVRRAISNQKNHSVETTYGFALGISDSLIHGNDQTRSLHRAANRVDLDQTGLPDKCIQIVSDAIGSVNINTNPFLPA
jgi:hypothetical protein